MSFDVQKPLESLWLVSLLDTHTHNKKTTKYNPLIQALRIAGWQVNPLITITTCVRGAIHKHHTKDIEELKIPKNEIKALMKQLHLIAIKYLTYLIQNKRKLDNKIPPIDPPWMLSSVLLKVKKPTFREGGSTLTVTLG